MFMPPGCLHTVPAAWDIFPLCSLGNYSDPEIQQEYPLLHEVLPAACPQHGVSCCFLGFWQVGLFPPMSEASGWGPGLNPLWSPTATPEKVTKELRLLASTSHFIGTRTAKGQKNPSAGLHPHYCPQKLLLPLPPFAEEEQRHKEGS